MVRIGQVVRIRVRPDDQEIRRVYVLRNQDSCPNRTSTPFHSLDRSSGVPKFPIDLGERIDDVVRSDGQIRRPGDTDQGGL
jgi:hypothetical protein